MAPKVTRETVQQIVGLDVDPIRRNYEITQAYADISRDFRDALGLADANWCTFATWASATAGDFIRADMFPEFLLGKLSDNATFSHHLAAMMSQATPGRLTQRRTGIRDIVVRVAEAVALQIAEGNLLVFSELAPEFVELNGLYQSGAPPSVDDVQAHFAGRLTPGASQHGGQTRLLEAFAAYAEAAVENNPARRAQLTLHGNVLIGFHEQIRLQPAIAGGLDAPFQQGIDELLGLVSSWAIIPAARRATQRRLRGLLDGPLSGSVCMACNVYRDALTAAAMSLRLPDRVVRLGRDVSYPRDGLPAVVCAEAIVQTSPELAILMESLGMLSDGTENSGARDWTRMMDRMPFILDLFRSTQHMEQLFNEPLTERERASLLSSATPTDVDRLAA